jgi:type IV pilus assembly protein PilO
MDVRDVVASVTRPQRLAAGIFGLLIVAVLGYVLLLLPRIEQRAALRQQNEKLQAEVRQARETEANLRPFRVQAEALRKRLKAAKERLPSEKEMPALYRQLTDIASQSGLQLAVFAAKPPVDREDVAEVPIAMTSEGNYHQLGVFFSRMSRLPRIVDLSDFRLVGIDRPTGTVRAELNLGTFVFRPEGAPLPVKAGTPAPTGGAAAKKGTGL